MNKDECYELLKEAMLAFNKTCDLVEQVEKKIAEARIMGVADESWMFEVDQNIQSRYHLLVDSFFESLSDMKREVLPDVYFDNKNEEQ